MSVLLAPIESYLWAGLAVLLLAGGLYECHRLEVIGENRVKLADAAARADEQKKAAVIQEALQAKADEAEEERDAAQQSLETYMASHSIGVVRLCRRPADSGHQLSAATPAQPGAESPSTGPITVPEVSTGSPGPDIGPALDTLVRVAVAVSGNYAELQRRQVTP